MTSRASGRRMVLKAGGAAALALLSGGAFAQTYPARPLTLIVPFAAGGPRWSGPPSPRGAPPSGRPAACRTAGSR